jgi:nucleotide-binding universal stress UspA family protein
MDAPAGQVLAALDASLYTQSVCRHAAWAASRLSAPMACLHVVERRAADRDEGGELEVDPATVLLDEPGLLEAAGKLAGAERGRMLLQQAAALAASGHGVVPRIQLRRGALVDAFREAEPDVGLFVVGRRGEQSEFGKARMGSQLERVVRATGRPLLVAFDGSATTRRGLEWVARSPLFAGLDIRVVTVGDDGAAGSSLAWALETLRASGAQAAGRVVHGDPQEAIGLHAEAIGADLLVMGAYGHSRIRQLIVGSTTSTLLRSSRIPVLLLR